VSDRQVATRNEDKPDPCEVKRAKGAKENNMKKLVIAVFVVVIGAVVLLNGCSKEDRDEALNRIGKAGKALNGETRPDDRDNGTPNIVAEQQRKERIRQNTEWTPENQALHPIEYCQAQLEEIAKISSQLEVQAHKYAVAKSQVQRAVANAEAQANNFEKFIESGKKAYREAEANSSWPASFNGYSLSKEKLQEKLVEASRRIKPLRESVAKNKTVLASLGRKSDLVSKRQRETIELKERLNITISDLKLKKLDDGSEGLKDTLNALNDALSSLGNDASNPSLDDLAVPDTTSATQAEFDALMAN
jgi:hypothetical protein